MYLNWIAFIVRRNNVVPLLYCEKKGSHFSIINNTEWGSFKIAHVEEIILYLYLKKVRARAHRAQE